MIEIKLHVCTAITFMLSTWFPSIESHSLFDGRPITDNGDLIHLSSMTATQCLVSMVVTIDDFVLFQRECAVRFGQIEVDNSLISMNLEHSEDNGGGTEPNGWRWMSKVVDDIWKVIWSWFDMEQFIGIVLLGKWAADQSTAVLQSSHRQMIRMSITLDLRQFAPCFTDKHIQVHAKIQNNIASIEWKSSSSQSGMRGSSVMKAWFELLDLFGRTFVFHILLLIRAKSQSVTDLCSAWSNLEPELETL
jgi:hypothetical protein